MYRDGMIQHLKVSMYCHGTLIHYNYNITRLAERVAQYNNNLALDVNWHLCFFSHDNITFLAL